MKKRYLVFLIISWVILIGIIPLNFYVISIPDILVVAAILMVCAINILFLIRSGSRKVLKIIMSVISLVVIGAFLMGGIVCNPYWNCVWQHVGGIDKTIDYNETLTSKEAIEDLDYAMHYLKKCHPAFRKEVPSEIQKRYEDAKADLESVDNISVNDLYRKIEYIFSSLGDAHTYTMGNYNYHFLRYWYEDSDITGATLVAVNGEDVDHIAERCKDLFSYEAKSWEMVRLMPNLTTLEGLDYIGFDNSSVTYTFELNGELVEKIYSSEDFVTKDKLDIVQNDSDYEYKFVSYTIDEENSLAILTLNECTNDDTYRSELKKMFTEVKEKGIKNVAVDIRKNGGGSDSVVSEFFTYLDHDSYNMVGVKVRRGPFEFVSENKEPIKIEKKEDLLFKGDFYLLSSDESFSSAMIFAQYVKDNHIGTIIGEAPGNAPNGYGDISVFTLPNSKLYMSVSTKQFQRADRECSDYLVEPDICCDADEAVAVLYETIGGDEK